MSNSNQAPTADTHQPVEAFGQHILVEFGRFGLIDQEVDDCPTPWPASLDDDAAPLAAVTNRIDIHSQAGDHLVEVTVERWAGEPSPLEPPWQRVGQVSVEFTTGVLEVWSVTMGPARDGEPFTVGEPGTYAVRCWQVGGPEAAALHRAAQPIPDGTQRYRLQLWGVPAR